MASPPPGVNIPFPDLLVELRSGRMSIREFIALKKQYAEAMVMAPIWRGSGDPPPPEQTVNWPEEKP